MTDETDNYFDKHRSALYLNYNETGEDECLREAQAGAYWAVRSHYTTKDSKTIVVMPTGSGKTAVMTLVALSVTHHRLLIIAPSRVIREQIAREFQTLKIAKLTCCLPNDLPSPSVHIVEHQLSTLEKWHNLEDFNVVIATPKCVSPLEDGVFDNPPIDLFDTMIFDEAHHYPASTWAGLADHFSDSKIIAFTATPFRNDKKPIPGDIVYSYPLARAIEKGIYRPIDFIPVDGHGDQRRRDHNLATKALEIWEEES